MCEFEMYETYVDFWSSDLRAILTMDSQDRYMCVYI